MKKAITYYRVSTKDQGLTGLGLDAQQKAVQDFVRRNDLQLVAEFREIESGRDNKRPVLKKALRKCEAENAILTIATLDRLSRNLAFITALMETKAKFLIADMPHADKFLIHIMGAVAQFQADQTSRNTRAALAAAKAKGVQLGVYGKNVLSRQNRQAADDFAARLQPVVQRYNEQGIKSVRRICKELNRRKVATYTGRSKWHATSVQNLLKRIRQIQAAPGEQIVNT